MSARPFTPDELAHRWGCSGETVRAMIRRGDLPAFRVGGRLLRISRKAVEQIEGTETCKENIESDDLRGASSSHGQRTESANATALRVLRGQMRRVKLAT